MKRTYVLSLGILILSMVGCDHDSVNVNPHCNNGILEPDEVCDGNLFSPTIHLICRNGAPLRRGKLKCTRSCDLDVSAICGAECGNGYLEYGEECDGNAIPAVTTSCRNPDLSQLSCDDTCHLVDAGVCAGQTTAQFLDTCGNGKLDDGEICDGDQFREGVRQCPDGMEEVANAEYSCLGTCRLVDIRKACRSQKAQAECGNGMLELDEPCDGELMNSEALENYKCPTGLARVPEHAVCSSKCEFTSLCYDPGVVEFGLMFSEVVPHVAIPGKPDSLDGLALEIANMSTKPVDTSSCSIALIRETGIQKKYALADLGITSLDAHKTKVICSQKEDYFGGACDAVISQNNLVDSLNRSIVLLGIVCGDNDAVQDLLNMVSVDGGIEAGMADATRMCSSSPARESKNAKFGDNWELIPETEDAPRYGLGKHCENLNAGVTYCQYTVSRTELTDRSQTIDLALEIKIPGVTDISDKTDVDKDLKITFYAGTVDGTEIEREPMHVVTPVADETWTNGDGIDRYVGTLSNWDMVQGFLAQEARLYVLDAGITRNDGASTVYCGPKGIVPLYSYYNPEERNTLNVDYGSSECGNGVIERSEVCEGDTYIPEVLQCPEDGQMIIDYSKLSCSQCGYVVMTVKGLCGASPETCGNAQVDAGEVCDGADLPDDAKVCPAGFVPLDDAKWACLGCLGVDHREACERACGNGKIDENVPTRNGGTVSEKCDGDIVPEKLRVCGKGEIAVDNPKWTCNDECSGVVTKGVCVNACGNGKLDKGVFGSYGSQYDEICDGSLMNMEAAAEACGKDGRFRADRARCTSSCTLDASACVPDLAILFDEFLVAKDETGKAVDVAFSLKNLGDSDIDVSQVRKTGHACNIKLFDASGNFISSWAYLALDPLVRAADGTDEDLMKPCRPYVFCGGAGMTGTDAEGNPVFNNAFGDKCDYIFYDLENPAKNLFLDYSKLASIHMSCNGVTIDSFDAQGLRNAILRGTTHGKLKASDTDPWSGVSSVKLDQRMDLDSTGNLASFAEPGCN